MKKRALILTIFLHAVFLMLVYIFQGIIFPFMRINGLVPLMLPVAVTGIALYEGQYTGGVAGLFAGILCDVSFNQPVGVFTVVLTFSGLLVGTLADSVVLRGFVTYYISCAAVLVMCAFIQIFSLTISLVSAEQVVPTQAMISTMIQQTIFSLLLAFPIWFFVRALGKYSERFLPMGRSAQS